MPEHNDETTPSMDYTVPYDSPHSEKILSLLREAWKLAAQDARAMDQILQDPDAPAHTSDPEIKMILRSSWIGIGAGMNSVMNFTELAAKSINHLDDVAENIGMAEATDDILNFLHVTSNDHRFYDTKTGTAYKTIQKLNAALRYPLATRKTSKKSPKGSLQNSDFIVS